MGIGVGGGIGPVRAGVRVSDGEIGGFVLLLIGVALAIFAFLLAVVLLPLAGAVYAAIMLSRRRVPEAVAISIVSVGLAAFAWPYAYSFLRYTEPVPKVTGGQYDVDRAEFELYDAGFLKVRVHQQGPESSDAFCFIESTDPAARAQVDVRETVTLNRVCSPPAN